MKEVIIASLYKDKSDAYRLSFFMNDTKKSVFISKFKGKASAKTAEDVERFYDICKFAAISIPETHCRQLYGNVPADLQRVIKHWNELPKSAKKTMFYIVKANRKRKTTK